MELVQNFFTKLYLTTSNEVENDADNEVEDKNYIKLAQAYHFLKGRIDYNTNHESISYLKGIIDNGFDINYKLPFDCLICQNEPQYWGNTVLHFVIEFYNQRELRSLLLKDCLDLLIKCGADLNIQNDSGYTPLLLALVKDQNIDFILHRYLEVKNFKNIYCKNGISHFHAACSTNLIEIINNYLKTEVPINEHVNNDSPYFAGYTPLHFAMHFCQTQTIELLLKNGASLNSKDANGMTPFHLFIKNLLLRNDFVDVKILKFLQNVVSNNLFDLPDDAGFNYTHISSILGNFKFQEDSIDVNTPVSLDSPICAGYTPLHFAAHSNFDTVLLLLKMGADLLAKDINGITPFDLCLKKFKLNNIIEILFEEEQHQLSNLEFSNDIPIMPTLMDMAERVGFEQFLEYVFEDVNAFVPVKSQIWPGCSLLHLAIILNGPLPMIFARSEADFTIQDVNDMSPLHIAFRMMKVEVVSMILDLHTNKLANIVDRDNLSFLHIACAAKNIKAVEYLLLHGADPNVSTLCDFQWKLSNDCNIIKAGSTPLHVAVHLACTIDCDFIDVLLRFGAKPYLADANGITPFHIALKYHCEIIFKQLLKFDQDYRWGYEKMGLTRLHIACFTQDLLMAKKEVALGADVNKRIDFYSSIWPGDTALHILYRKNFDSRNEFVELLFEHGADPCLQNANNLTPVHLSQGEIFLKQGILPENFYFKNPVNNQGQSHFHVACMSDNLETVENFIKSGININTPVEYFADYDAGYTPLHYAVKSNNTKLIELLLDNGADPNIKAANGFTPLHLAVSLKNDILDEVEALLRCPTIDIQATNILEETALEMALESYPVNRRLFNALLSKGAGIKFSRFIAEKPDRSKIIFDVIRWEKLFIQTFRQLIANIPDLTDTDKNGKNAIHHISSNEFPESLSKNFLKAVEALVDRGCDLNHKDNKGKTALHLAVSSGHLEMVKILLAIGADINIKNSYQKTPYAYVKKKNNGDLRLAFVQHIRKLEAVGLYVDKSNQIDLSDKDICMFSNNNINKEKEAFDTWLKKEISPSFSTAQFFTEQFVNDYQLIPASHRQAIDNFCTSDELSENYPDLYSVIKLQFNKFRTKFRMNLLDESTEN